MDREFLPFNYMRTLFQQFQNLRQGSRFVDEYLDEFYLLVNRTDIRKTTDQLVCRYIGRLRLPFQDMLNNFSPTSLSEAHQCDILLERQFQRRPTIPAAP